MEVRAHPGERIGRLALVLGEPEHGPGPGLRHLAAALLAVGSQRTLWGVHLSSAWKVKKSKKMHDL